MNIDKRVWSAEEPDAGFHDAPRRRKWLIALAAGGLILLAVLGWRLLGAREAPPPPASLPTVTVVVPGHRPVDSLITTTGTLGARREMPVGVAGEGGMVSRVLVEQGSWVGAGQVLATIDRSVQVQQTGQMGAQVTMAQADARIAQADLDRAQKLLGRGFVAKADIDRKTATRDAMRAKVRVAQAQYGEMNARMARLDIRAPAAGLVLARAVEPGQIVSSASGALFRIARGGEIELRAMLAESDLARLRVGIPATVTPVGAATGFKGTVWQLAPTIDPTTRQGEARIALAYDPQLRPGGFASATLATGSVDAPLLPESAVQSDAKGNYVFIVDGANTVVRRDVKTGEASDSGIAILAGLQGNERVVLSAGAFLNPGEKVAPERQAAR